MASSRAVVEFQTWQKYHAYEEVLVKSDFFILGNVWSLNRGTTFLLVILLL